MIRKHLFLIVYLLLAGTWMYLFFHETVATPVSKPLAEFPVACAEWRMDSQASFSKDVLEILRPSDYLFRKYASPAGEKIALYVGYHDGGKGSGEIHTPRNCLPGNGWELVSTDKVQVETNKGQVAAVSAVYQKNDSQELFLYWFQSQRQTLTDEFSLKLAQILTSITQKRRDTAFVRISVPIAGDEREALATGTRFIRDFYPQITNFLPM
jgi:EpsI family protein